MSKLCSECSLCLVSINPKMVSTRLIEDAKPFASPSIVKGVRCKRDVWKPLTSLALLPTVEHFAEDCQYYENEE